MCEPAARNGLLGELEESRYGCGVDALRRNRMCFYVLVIDTIQLDLGRKSLDVLAPSIDSSDHYQANTRLVLTRDLEFFNYAKCVK